MRRIARSSVLLIAVALVACTQSVQRQRERQVSAIAVALASFSEWYGPYPHAAPTPESLGLKTYLWSPASTHTEREAFRAVARRFWSNAGAPASSRPPELVEGIAEFSANRLARDVYADDSGIALRFLDDRVPWVVRGVTPGSPPPRSGRALLALMTLERYIGWPVLQQALAELRVRAAATAVDGADLLAVAGEISGRSLSWMEGLFDESLVYDYGIDRVETRKSSAAAAYEIEIVARRYGDGQFTGSVRPRAGPFESGRGIALRVVFADGQEIDDTWDGRDAQRRFVYESAAPVVSVTLDPAAVIAVDTSRANNSFAVPQERDAANLAALAWSARWAGWLQDRLLLWSVLL